MKIAARFNGPPGSANGGYTAGLLAEQVPDGIDGVEVTLRRPPPLETELALREVDLTLSADGTPGASRLRVPMLRAYAGDDLIAEAIANAVADDEVVAPVDFDLATSVSAGYLGFAQHPFPTCFVCGPGRPANDGLRLFAGRLPDGRTAAPFVAPPEISRRLVWASLDCPGGWAIALETRPYVLGRIAARVDAVPAPGEECVVVGALIEEQGRKAFVRSSLYGPTGALLATARATWFAV